MLSHTVRSGVQPALGLMDLPCAKDFHVLCFFCCIAVRQLWSSQWEHSDIVQLCLLLQQLLYIPGRSQNKTKSSCAVSPWVTKHLPPGKKMVASVDYVNLFSNITRKMIISWFLLNVVNCMTRAKLHYLHGQNFWIRRLFSLFLLTWDNKLD